MVHNHKSFTITGTALLPTTFQRINVDAKTLLKPSLASIMNVYIREPFATYTEQFTLSYVNCNTAYTNANGNFMKAYKASGGATPPAVTTY